MTASTPTQEKFNLVNVIEDLFLVLSPKEKEVIMKRFQLGENQRMTLESIGQAYSVTRERIRQIEKVALTKLRRVSDNTKLALVLKTAKEILLANGGVMREDILISKTIKTLSALATSADGPIIRLALAISQDFEEARKNLMHHPYWRSSSISTQTISLVGEMLFSILSKRKDIAPADSLAYETEEQFQTKGQDIKKETVQSVMDIDKRFKRVKDGVGLNSWRHINPRSIRDKSLIVLKQNGSPMHFMEIANRISASGFDKKTVTTQAVHNELIRDENFVLVGRGLYALKEWGFKAGTVSEIIEDILRKKSPLSKQEIITQVLKQRQVKKGTISLNLQKDGKFKRVGRAMYAID